MSAALTDAAGSSDDERTSADTMTRGQWIAVATMIALNALDGFDVLSVSFASPGIARAWGIDRAALGVVLSMELVGMALGSIVLGRLCDRIGRRPVMLGCLLAMATGMAGAAMAGGLMALSAWRVATGIGIGGMLAATNAAVADFASPRRRALCVVLMAGGYPVGTIVGGSISASLLVRHDWPVVFALGACAACAMIPILIRFAPETPASILRRRPGGALESLNRSLARLGLSTVGSLPAVPSGGDACAPRLLSKDMAPTTLLLTLAYLAHITTFYFVMKWLPKIAVDLGLSPSQGAWTLVCASSGGAAGSLLLGLLTMRYRVVGLTIIAMLASTALVTGLGFVPGGPHALAVLAAATGFCTNAGVVGLYAIVAAAYPAATRGSATGFVIGIGRGGSALAPAVAGAMFAAGVRLDHVAMTLAIGSAVAAIAIAILANGARPIGGGSQARELAGDVSLGYDA